MSPSRGSGAAPPGAPRVDVHAHLMPAAALRRPPAGMRGWATDDPDELGVTADGRDWTGRGVPRGLRDLATHRALQAEHGLDLTVLSPWIDLVRAPRDAPVQADWCRALNAGTAAELADDPAFAWLAAIPDLDGGAAADVLAEAATLGARGAILAATTDTGTLARPDLDRLWAEAERCGLPLFVHPGEYEPPVRLRDGFLVNLVGNPFETALAAAAMLTVDVPGRFPDLRVLLAHGGGMLPFQHGRLEAGFARRPELRDATRGLPDDVLRWFWYDTVLFATEPLRYLLERVGPDRVLAGSDAPFLMCDHAPFVEQEALGLDADDRDRVIGGNAVDLLAGPL